ncbi:protease Do [Denitrovibrio acetiphilus DSM 12809]|uniref:Probable periplasmic serine endoprotease DegP-like n=1 Tax=Denitrovibrio acetiphilus (strain DSM 12809 / NBRC 114555 / N2460) TaxID=522772 RepID=D4H1H3_DENA2|nr:Do family serine endopeptidase [Denitrovibrio acetiphilus]ADD68733.1 protease Do [Denitrovibrio acetiphilus DSM 12809]
MKKISTLILVIFCVSLTTAFAGGPESFSGIYKNTKDSVVNISTTKVITRRGQSPDELFRRFFGDNFPGIPNEQQGKPREYKSKALGSGFIIDKSGLIITNNHVVDGADEIIVKLNDEHKFDAKVIGRDPLTDLALIKIEPKGVMLHTLPLGDSDEAEIGDWVVAIGNPLGLEWTITAGIISAKKRVLGSGPYDNFLQTDASINPGNSGGPLINMDGEVVAINTAIIPSGQGLGFAVPVNMLKELLPKLKTGTVKRGWLGVMVQPIDEKLAKGFGLEEPKGALIADVTKGDPAEVAGVMAGDVVLKINGDEIEDSKELVNKIGRMSPGESITLTVLRDKKEKNIKVKLGERKDGTAEVNTEPTVDLPVVIESLTSDELSQLGIPGGVKVTGVEGDSNAYEAGLRRGMVIVAVNHEQVNSSEEFSKKYKAVKKGDVVVLQVYTAGKTNFIAYDKD